MAHSHGSASSPGHVYLRSRRGCETCRTKKVKCDEQRSICGRCSRLDLRCDWIRQATVKERKRLQKTRAAPKEILPEPSRTSHPPEDLPTAEQSSTNELVDYLGANNASEWCTSDSTGHVIDGFNTWPDDLWSFDLSIDDPSQPLALDSIPSATGSQLSLSDLKSPYVDIGSFELSRTLNTLKPDLSIQKLALTPSFQVTKREHHALHHFQTQFSLSRTSKCPSWSTHALMLHLGWELPMTMHLIIASSLTDLSLRSSENKALYHFAVPHFRAGLQLLIDLLNSGGEPDHTTVLPAFFFVYVYMTMRQDTPAQDVSQLSQMVLNHVRRYNLDGRPAAEAEIHYSIPQNNTAFTSRMLIWLFYEDVASCSLGQGGTLARYLLSDPDHLREIYEQSTTSLEACWGQYYPDSEAVDDVENATVLRSLFDVMSFFQNINQLYEFFTVEESERIRKDLDALEEVCTSNLNGINMGTLTNEEITCLDPAHQDQGGTINLDYYSIQTG